MLCNFGVRLTYQSITDKFEKIRAYEKYMNLMSEWFPLLEGLSSCHIAITRREPRLMLDETLA